MRATRFGFSISPVIGVRHLPLERRLAELLGEPFRRYGPGSISQGIGYVMPQRTYVSWEFAYDRDTRATVEDMVGAILTFGRAYIEQHRDLTSICDAMAAGEGLPHMGAERLPIALVALGRESEARELAKALALGAIEVLEGTARPLKRNRRLSAQNREK